MPRHPCICWVQVGGAWALSMACLLFMRLLWLEGLSRRFATCFWPLMEWMSLWAFILYVLLLFWAGSCLIVGLSFFNPFLTLFAGRLTPQSCHPVVPTMLLFDLVLAGPLLGLLYAFLLLNSSSPALFTRLVLVLFWASLAHFILLGILGPFHFLRRPRPISILYSHRFLLSPFGLHLSKLPYPLLSGFMGFSTSPKLLSSFLRLLQPILACLPFLIMPVGLSLLSSGSFGPICFLWGPCAIF